MDEELLRRRISEAIDKAAAEAFAGMTCTAEAPPPEPLTLEKFDRQMLEWKKLARQAERSRTIYQVEMGRHGPPVASTEPSGATRVELSWLQARELHKAMESQGMGLYLRKVIDPQTAEFEAYPPHFGAGMLAVTSVPPPWDMPPQDDEADPLGARSFRQHRGYFYRTRRA